MDALHETFARIAEAYPTPPRPPYVVPECPPARPRCPTRDQVVMLGVKVDEVLAQLAEMRRSLAASQAAPAGKSSQA